MQYPITKTFVRYFFVLIFFFILAYYIVDWTLVDLNKFGDSPSNNTYLDISHHIKLILNTCVRTYSQFPDSCLIWSWYDCRTLGNEENYQIQPAKVHSFCKQCLHKDIVFINWQLMSALSKGQLISKGNFSVFNSPKKIYKKMLIFALAY